MTARIDSLCWKCDKATNGCLCEWAYSLLPVDGWTAVPTKVNMSDRFTRLVDSFCVLDCPRFKKDERSVSERANGATNEALTTLVRDIVLLAISDWKAAGRVLNGSGVSSNGKTTTDDAIKSREDIEEFLLGSWFLRICDMDGRKILELLRSGEMKRPKHTKVLK